MIFLDTHAVVWLYEGRSEIFPAAAAEAINKNELFISPMVILEMEYLFEIKRITRHGETIFEDLRSRIGLRLDDSVFFEVTRVSLTLTWARDPFDRLITAAASLHNAGLISKDSVIAEHYQKTIWK